MADPSPSPDSSDNTRMRSDRESPPGTPRWVILFGIIALVVVLLVVIMMVVGGGSHGPNRHTSSGDPGSDTLPSSVITENHTPSGGGPGSNG